MATRSPTLNIAARRGATPTLGVPATAGLTAPGGTIGAVPEDLGTPLADESAQASRDPVVPHGAQRGREDSANAELRTDPFASLATAAVGVRHQRVDSSPFASLAADDSARRNMHALRVLSRLVAAIVRKPGSGAPEAVRSAHLGALIRSVNSAADRLVASIAPLDAHRGWIKSSAIEASANMVASQWETDSHGEVLPLDVQIEAVEAVFREARQDAEIGAAIESLGDANYVEATTRETASQRVELSSRLAAWDLYGHVTSPVLGQGAYRFTYSRNPSEIVGLLLPHALAAAREAAMQTRNLDVRTSHLQACIRRAADLMGAEYVARTRALMNWIADESIPDEEYRKRHASGCAAFEKNILPALVESARRNFFAVEAMSTRSIEELHVDQPAAEQPRNA